MASAPRRVIIETPKMRTSMHTLFSVNGRLGRESFLDRYLVNAGFCTIVLLLFAFQEALGLPDAVFSLAAVLAGVSILTLLSASIRRLHDIDRPGWHLLFFAIPVYNLYLFLALLGVKGEEAMNPYGRRPEAL
jgi:uncharacterized membrane protein YhaH (DUF805 family)